MSTDKLSFDDAKIDNGGSYLRPGIHDVIVREVKSGESSQKGTPFIEMTIEDSLGKTCSHICYTSTTKAEGKQSSAWDISKNILLTFATAVTGSEENARELFKGATDYKTLATKMNSTLTGKKLRISLKGKWINPTDVSKPSWIKAEFGNGKFAEPISTTPTTLKVQGTKGESRPSTTTEVSDGAAITSDKEW